MAYYEIDCEQCSKEAEYLLKLEKEMLQYIRQIEGIEKELGKLSGFGAVVSALAKTIEELYHEKDSMRQMGEVLHASIQCYKHTEKKLSSLKSESSLEKPKDRETDPAAGEGIHFALDCLGLLPGIGAVFDGINACWYICEGRWGEALLSGLALIPAVGIVAGAGKAGGKAGMKALSHADDMAGLAKGLDKLDDMSDAAKGLDTLDDTLDMAKYGDDIIKGGINSSLLDELASSGVKYNPDDVVTVMKNSNGKLMWLENGNSKAGLTHILERHADDFVSQGVDDIPKLLENVLSTNPIKTGGNAKGLFADYMLNGNSYRVAYGTNGYVVSFYPID